MYSDEIVLVLSFRTYLRLSTSAQAEEWLVMTPLMRVCATSMWTTCDKGSLVVVRLASTVVGLTRTSLHKAWLA